MKRAKNCILRHIKKSLDTLRADLGFENCLKVQATFDDVIYIIYIAYHLGKWYIGEINPAELYHKLIETGGIAELKVDEIGSVEMIAEALSAYDLPKKLPMFQKARMVFNI